MSRLLHFNHTAVLASALVQWVLAVVWYSPFLFGPSVKAALGNGRPQKERGAAVGLIVSLFASLALSFFLLHVMQWMNVYGIKRGAYLGLALWIGFIAAPMAANSIHENRPFKLFAVSAGYWLFALLAGGVILGRLQ